MCLQFPKMLIGLQKYWSIHKVKILASHGWYMCIDIPNMTPKHFTFAIWEKVKTCSLEVVE